MNNLIWILSFALLAIVAVKYFYPTQQQIDDNYSPIVQLNSGKVIGTVLKQENANHLYFYQGIQYGRAARFENPQPVVPWTGVYDAVTSRPACAQPEIKQPTQLLLTQQMANSEDCLYLNVWTPAKQNSNKKRPVMFFIHGGAFVFGSIFSPFTDGQLIASLGDVVVVSVAYRLGPFGFLHGGDVVGNFGLQDQILGLKWVRDNVGRFGGDPNEITIFGISAGSMSVGALLLSPLTNGMFKRAILQAGAPNSLMGANSAKLATDATKRLASKLDCPTEDIQAMVNCIRTKSTEQITNATSNTFEIHDFFVPVYGVDEVLPISPVEALKSGKFNRGIDVMFGVARDEGSMFVAQIFPKLVLGNEKLTLESTRDDIEYMMNVVYGQSNGKEVAQFYTESLVNPTNDDFKITIASACGDFYLTCPTILFGEQIAAHEPQSRYYAYRTIQPLSSFPHYQNWMGVSHGADGIFIHLNQMLQRSQDKQLGRDLIGAFTSFAKSGNPGKMDNVQWEEAFKRIKGNEKPSTRYMALNVENYKMNYENYYLKNCGQFWKGRINQ